VSRRNLENRNRFGGTSRSLKRNVAPWGSVVGEGYNSVDSEEISRTCNGPEVAFIELV